jgi:hypothetical protein
VLLINSTWIGKTLLPFPDYFKLPLDDEKTARKLLQILSIAVLHPVGVIYAKFETKVSFYYCVILYKYYI